MKIGIIVYSKTGNTKKIANLMKTSLEKQSHKVDIIDVIAEQQPGFFKAGYLAIRQKKLAISNDSIDISSFDLVLIGCPVWAGKPAPFIHSMVLKSTGFEKIKTAIFITCAGGEESGSKVIDLIQSTLEEEKADVLPISLIVHMSRKGEIKKEMPPVKDFLSQVLDRFE